ncbi:2,3-bisphosphoglycerate-independent phosphoglycerate mutase [Spiroplasma citri]|uniref:2,3-bisphosphoglycerate-independent phosphoglycerate mutase n=1 Tax=Spiroplasma citri TaxID=2133 RepID=Q14PB9_SPICI|nr:2,3-bisphosphoglycerate-independent phosphoglycerate mutase [Spiroplasma citri]APE74335.1 putative 2,3-bisphosphoglycerate-independent phosphoglycerate mutase [Spiroplasma citri]QED24289.1 2,3-bisphosphoglycerate-independent phosphoglycerate mutase [Spiroplasma citri]QIA66553.1 2,3-bisphosphoglycerate-independent phosphoglycerate mutase [Spiroplasma citri]QIA68434.1 2,3-bisphosphoglycerate-independent phosphoglycerate mutase [Spiroplasma citri]QIA70309.1 2,3-bisphosphoglycerate-independent 
MKAKQPILLAILDGWGIAPDSKGNAVTQGHMVNVEKLKTKYPWVSAHAAGEWVGLPEGQMGNSEVGHIHLGAGRIKYESLTLINKTIKDGTFNQNPELLAAINFAKKSNGAFHIMGLFSVGGVHSHLNHIFAAYKLAAQEGIKEIYLHIFGDGRDTKPECIKIYLEQFQQLQNQLKVGEIATIGGRYYAMDRDKKYDRVQIAYDVLVSRKGSEFSDPIEYINREYQAGRNDEFLMPAYNINTPKGYIKSGDGVFFANFRPDRAIAIASALTNPNFPGNEAQTYFMPKLHDIYFVSMMEYAETVASKHVAFKPIKVVNGLGEWLSKKGYRQLRIAETEKIAHVTFFFDGGKDYFKNGLATQAEITLTGASADLIPSPKVATYDLKPEMSAYEITDKLITELNQNEFDVIILNFANCDMVGHTGILPAAIEAVKTIDNCLGKIYTAIQKVNGIMIITADHGNVEIMIDETGGPNKKHTSQLVPIIITKEGLQLRQDNPAIADIAPTILDLLGEGIPPEMTQPSLIIK